MGTGNLDDKSITNKQINVPDVFSHLDKTEYTPCLFSLTVYGKLDIALICFVREGFDAYWGVYLFEDNELLADPIIVFDVDLDFTGFTLKDLYVALKSITQILSFALAEQKIDLFALQEKTLNAHSLLQYNIDTSKFAEL
jgi:hypothetical protein